MKHLKIYENFYKSYYKINMIEFYNNFRNIFNEEKNIKDKNKESYSDGIFSFLDDILPNWQNNVLAITIEKVIKFILQDKEVECFDVNGTEEIGRVKFVRFYPKAFSSKKDHFYFNIRFYGGLADVDVECSKTIKIYGEKTKIEKYIEMVSNTKKYNL
jgi:hypothetical protein